MPTQRFAFLGTSALGLLITVELFAPPSFASEKCPAPKQKIVAQRLVEEALARHPEVTGIELAVRSLQGCLTLAASEPKDIGEMCDQDELEAMRTGQPWVEKESDGFDVTMPLRDMRGKTIGTVGMDFKPEPGQQRSIVVGQATKIAHELEAQIPSRAKLFELTQRH